MLFLSYSFTNLFFSFSFLSSVYDIIGSYFCGVPGCFFSRLSVTWNCVLSRSEDGQLILSISCHMLDAKLQCNFITLFYSTFRVWDFYQRGSTYILFSVPIDHLLLDFISSKKLCGLLFEHCISNIDAGP